MRTALEQRSRGMGATSALAEELAVIGKWIYGQGPVTTIHGVEVIYLYVTAALIIFGWVGLLLGEFGHFSLATLGILALPLTVGAFLALRQTWRSRPITWSWDLLGALPALLIAVALFTPPFEWIVGGSDPGVYVSTGANIARTGSISFVDQDLAALSGQVRDAIAVLGVRLTGFYVADMDRGLVVPHGFHLYPTMLAIAHAIGGIYANLWATPIIVLLGLLGFYLLVRRLFGGIVALLAAVFLAINPAVVYFARYPAAENLVLLWLFGGLLAFVLMLDTGDRRLAVLAGLTLGAVHLTKIEQVALPVALGGFFTYQWLVRRWRKEFTYFLGAYGFMLLHAVVHAYFVSYSYSYSLLDALVLRSLSPSRVIALAGVFALVVFGLVAGRTWIAQMLAGRRWSRIAPPVAVMAILVLAVYAYYVRPRSGFQLPQLGTLSLEELTAVMNRSSFVVLGWYVSTIGLFLGVIGYAVALVRRGSTRTALLLILVVLDTLLFLWDSHIRPLHFWAERRYIPMVFPAFALFSAYFLWQLQVALRGRWPEAIMPAALGFVLLVYSLGGWLPFLGLVEFRGAVEQVKSLSRLLPENSVALFDDSHAGQTLPAPLQYIWARTSFVPTQEANQNGMTQRLVEEEMARGREIYWVHSATESLPQSRGVYDNRSGEMPDVRLWGYTAVLVGEINIDLPTLLATIDHRPDTIERLTYDLQVFRILPRQSS